MLGYVTMGTNDLDRSVAFYDAVLEPLGGKRLMNTGRGWLYGSDRPALGVTAPFDGQTATAGNGAMAALTAPTREAVDAVYAKARELGAPCEGEPGLRGDVFYAAYFRDPDGNKLCIFKYG